MVNPHDSTRCKMPRITWHGVPTMESHDGIDIGIHGNQYAVYKIAICKGHCADQSA